MSDTLTIEEWELTHPRWGEILQFVEGQAQSQWVAFHADWHRSSHMLVAQHGTQLVGFLRFVTQIIGTDAEHDPITCDGKSLTEAKVLAFGVDSIHQRQGIGRALQEAALRLARTLGCYQLRSHSSGSHTANHQLKLRMGFAVHPVVRGDDTGGVYFIMPLLG
jgi:GNAT superfamily N-acetyltransferase